MQSTGLLEKAKIIEEIEESKDPRKLLRKSLQSRNVSEKIPSLAKKGENGKLICKVCGKSVNDIEEWNSHLKSQFHKQALINLRNKAKQKQVPKKVEENEGKFLVPEPVPKRTVKIAKKQEISQNDSNEENEKNLSQIQERKNNKEEKQILEKTDIDQEEVEEDLEFPIPEGFFDDKSQEAEARKQILNPKIQEFKKEISKIDQELVNDNEDESLKIVKDLENNSENILLDSIEEALQGKERLAQLKAKLEKKNKCMRMKRKEQINTDELEELFTVLKDKKKKKIGFLLSALEENTEDN